MEHKICNCPKCGEIAVAKKKMIAIYPMWRVECMSCGLAGLPMETSDEAIDVWNEAIAIRERTGEVCR